jgi:hypothetical protein
MQKETKIAKKFAKIFAEILAKDFAFNKKCWHFLMFVRKRQNWSVTSETKVPFL